VVGGGALGIICAHHLHATGVDVLVVERNEVAHATSTCGAGFIGLWGAGYYPSWGEPEVQCEWYGLEFYGELYQDVGSFACRKADVVYIASAEAHFQTYIQPIADYSAIPGREVLSAEQVAEAVTIADAAAVHGGVYEPHGLQLTARDATRASAERLVRQGGRIETGRRCTGILFVGGRVVGVATEQGDIHTDTVVLATATWSNALLRTIGTKLSYAPLGAMRITTEPIGVPGDCPMLFVPEESHAWIREEKGGLLFGGALGGSFRDVLLGIESPPDRLEQAPEDGVPQTRRLGEALAPMLPVLSEYRDFEMAWGTPCYTPDGRALLGAVPGYDGLFAMTGDNEAGVTHAPGFGRAMAELITTGNPFVDISPFEIGRFGDTFSGEVEVAAAMRDVDGVPHNWSDMTANR
jgi:sarcosine oxidase, subunit beta